MSDLSRRAESITLNQLRVLVEVVQLGQVSAAARKLGISQPSVSQQVRRIEESLGFPVLRSIDRKVELTPRGSDLYRLARTVSEAAADLEAIATGTRLGIDGSLSVAAHSSVATDFVASLFRQVSIELPTVKLSLMFGLQSEISDAVLSGKATIGLFAGPADYTRFEARTLFDIDVVLVASPSDPVGRRKRATHHEILQSQIAFVDVARPTIERSLSEVGLVLEPDRVLTFPKVAQVKKTAEAGLALAFLARESVLRELHHRYLVEVAVPDLVIRRPFEVVWEKDRPMNRLERRFLEIAFESLPARVGQNAVRFQGGRRTSA